MNPTPSPSTAGPMERLGPLPARRRRLALALLLTGRLDPDSPAVDSFLSFAQEQGLALDDLWTLHLPAPGSSPHGSPAPGRLTPITAGADETPAAAALPAPPIALLSVPCAGRTAMVFLSPATPRQSSADLAALLTRAIAALDPQRVHLLQVLLDPGQERHEQALAAAGFSCLAELVYLEHATRATPAGPLPAQWPAPTGRPITLTYVPWRTTRRDEFLRAILASYEGTLDCPRLVGRREPEDILESHLSVGRFDPDLWTLVLANAEPAGVMLLNPLPPQHALELVYLGLTPAWRGQGLGKMLLHEGLRRRDQEGWRTLLCAVDQDNAPAVALYRSLGFVATGRKRTWIYSLRPKNGTGPIINVS